MYRWLLPLVVVVLAIGVGSAFVVGQSGGESATVRILAKRDAAGNVEVGLQQRINGEWGERQAPRARFLTVEHDPGRWYGSSPLTVSAAPADAGESLTIAMLTFPGGTGRERIATFKLAIDHINAAGGVFGRPVIGVIGDSAGTRPDHTVITARRLVEDEGADAIIGGAFSSTTLAVVEAISKPLQIPTISPSATSPQLTTDEDGDFFFRAVLSDTWQGPALADLVDDLGYTNIGVIYIDDAWGTGLFASFAKAFTGTMTSAEVAADGETYLPELRRLAAGGAQALVVLAFTDQATVIIRESRANGLFEQFVFGDGGQSENIPRIVGPEVVAGMRGTAPHSPRSESTALWEEAHRARWGGVSDSTYIPAVYDATIAIALAAQAAGTTDGAAIRDQLRLITAPEGLRVVASVESLRAGLALLAGGGRVNYVAAGFQLRWDALGDLEAARAVSVWEFTPEGTYRTVE